ncbi:LOW QUALITY PROTEIN: hypothetical protein Cgig2_011537 [Carnegiea gigantea]|uniref:RRM domain-containing protein n=1 Tax=Carnegiea gigantea TaxID=171969 RepID=A0A9Q1K3S0_9CARY|nr:LOW QUALITY PROTEIN: hypothetical protein Cgig2_011537 [Carnegiea gigantea]
MCLLFYFSWYFAPPVASHLPSLSSPLPLVVVTASGILLAQATVGGLLDLVVSWGRELMLNWIIWVSKLFSGYGVVVDAYVPNKARRMSGRRYDFVRFGKKQKDEKAIEEMNGKIVGGNNLEARFQKRPASRLSGQRKAAQKQMVWKWIPKKNFGTMSNGASKDMEDKDIQVADDYQIANDGADGVNGCFYLDSSSSKTISQPTGTAKNHPCYIGKFNLQKPTSPSESFTNEEEIDSSLNILIDPNKLGHARQYGQSRSQRKKMINAHEETLCNAL